MAAKMVIVWRNDLKVRSGKKMSMAAHSSIAFLLHRLKETGKKNQFHIDLDPVEQEWINSGQTKITLQVDNEAELMAIYQKAKGAGLEVNLIIDAGRTEFDGPTKTCIAIGPDIAEKIDPITSHLKLH